MAFRVYDFMCEDGHIFDRVVNSETSEIECSVCKKIAKRVPSAPHLSAKMGIDPNSAQGNRWAKMHEEEAKRQNAQIDPNS